MQRLSNFIPGADLSAPTLPARLDRIQPASPWLCELSDFDLLRISGKDAANFLNAQLTNDLGEVSNERSQLGGYCTPQGRTYCTFRVFLHDGDYYMRTTSGLSDQVLARLKIYVLRLQASLDKDTALGGMALLGNGAGELLKSHGLSPPVTVSQSVAYASYRMIRAPGICERYEIYAPCQDLAKLWGMLSPEVACVTVDAWRLHDILSGIPNIYPETSELFLPQMINLELIDAVSFSKGCYPGQEIVARTHYLGKLKRRMYRFVSQQGSNSIEPGTAVFMPDQDSGQPGGEVVDACKLSDGTVHGLASLRMRGLSDQVEIRLAAPDGDIAHIHSLPYEVTYQGKANTPPDPES